MSVKSVIVFLLIKVVWKSTWRGFIRVWDICENYLLLPVPYPEFINGVKKSPSTYPCQSVSEWVSECVIDSFRLEIAIASLSSANLLYNLFYICLYHFLYEYIRIFVCIELLYSSQCKTRLNTFSITNIMHMKCFTNLQHLSSENIQHTNIVNIICCYCIPHVFL